DACNMAMTEIIYELADYTDYFVGSASPEPADGYDYNFISYFNGNISYLLDRLVYSYDNAYGYSYTTMVAIKTEGFRQFIKNNLKNISKDSLHNNAVYGLLNSDDFTDVNYVLNNYPDDMIINKSLGYSFSGYNISGIGIAYNIITDYYHSPIPDYRELLFYKENQNWVEKYNLW
ncbi:MAG TPA: clostripain-related cysteine peptidase, partial [Tepiditoga sp.]|nr:clostripain-related cysteine peptidase [Tepiditoga sp.]